MQRKDIPLPPAQPLTSQLAALSPEKRALLELRLEKQAPHARGIQTIRRRTNGNVAPLSFAQQRLWFLDQFAPHNPVYNTYRAWRVHGGLNVDALQKALDTIVARHDVLRTTFQVIDGQLLQVIATVASVGLTVVDLQELSATEREEKSVQLALQEAQLPFDITQGPLFRVQLVQLSAEDYVLLLTLHHMVADGWSIGVLHRELATLYEAFIVGQPSPLPPLPIQYSDYSLWQHEQLQGEELENQLTYWKQQLAALSLLEIPTDRPRPAVPSYRGERATFHVSATLTAQLKSLSRQENTTLFMTLLAAVKVLLCRYTGQDDLVVGTPIANREHIEIEPLIGMVVNTLVLRTDLRGDPSFRELLERVRNGALGAYAHQDLPFEKLVEELRPERDLSRNPLFQVSFTLQTTPDQALALSGLTITPFTTGSVSPFDCGNGTAKFDLTVSMVETEGELRGMLEYSTDLFDHATITRMASHLHTLLEGIVAHSERRVSELPLLTSTEYQQLVVE